MTIVHPIPDEHWPDESTARRARLFSPIAIGPLSLTTRTWIPAMVPWRATDDGYVTPAVLDWYSRFADGRPGAIVIEATGIRDIRSGPLLRIGHDRFVEGLQQLVDRVRAHSRGETRLFIQLIDFLNIKRRPEPEKFFQRFLTITRQHRDRLCALQHTDRWQSADERQVRAALQLLDPDSLQQTLSPREWDSLQQGYRERVTDTELEHIRTLPTVLPELFADAAVRAERAGFDGIELHYAHAYTMASFLSRLNTRDDGYGGSREGRVRLPIEVYRAVRSAVSATTVVGCRFLADEVIEGGSRIDDAVYFGVEFARAGMDFLSLSKGGKFEDAKQPRIGHAAYPYTGVSGHECMPTVRSDERGPFGRNLHLARDIRSAVRTAGFQTPIVAAGGINSFSMAERALEEGTADIIAAARQSLADPDWFLKIRVGEGASIRRCKFTNYCEALDQMHKQVTCQLWDRTFVEGEDQDLVARSHDGRRRLLAPPWRGATTPRERDRSRR